MGAQTAHAHSLHVLWRETWNFTSKLSYTPQDISALAVTARLQLRRRTTIAADRWWSVGLVVRKVGEHFAQEILETWGEKAGPVPKAA